MAVDLRSMTDTELDDLRIAVLLEQERRRVLSTAALNAAAIADQYAAATATEIAVDGTVVPQGGYAPGRLYQFGTIIWRNTSKAWISAKPDLYPQGWQQIDPPPTAAPAWAVGVAYKGGTSGSVVSRLGKTYRCITTHTSQADWSPEVAVSLWTPA